MAAIVQFSRGNKAIYSTFTAEERARKIFFAQDTNEIIVNGYIYGINLKSEDVNLVSSIEPIQPGHIKISFTNGKTLDVQTAPIATQTTDGLLSKEDKKILDEIPTVYATKEELKESVVRVYRFKGAVQYYKDLPTSDQQIGDTYNVLNAFEIDGRTYAAGTNVAWDGNSWDPLGGEDNGYSKEEADAKFVPWTENSIVLKKNYNLSGIDSDNSVNSLINIKDEQITVGVTLKQISLNSKERPIIELPDSIKEYVAYLSDVGVIDMSSYPETATMDYVPELTQSFIDNLGVNPIKVNGEDYDAVTNPYVIGENYIIVYYNDISLTTKYDLITSSKTIPNTTNAAIEKLRDEYINILTWKENS